VGKRLILLRHAKSSWENPGLRDFERPLSPRGERDAPRMGILLRERGFCPRAVISSDAVRARLTIELVAAEIGFPVVDIRYSNDLYHASPARLLHTLEDLAPQDDEVMLVGHNPGMTELANQLSDARLDNLPTCGIICISGAAANWRAMAREPGTVEWCLRPKLDLA
jgi:phosphohistidine phosphatase